MLGIALGCIGLRYDDFCRLTLEEFSHIYEQYNEREEMEERSAWERMRMLATICVQPYSKKRLKANELMRFPWDEEQNGSPTRPPQREGVVSKEEALKRFEKLVRKIKKRKK